MNKKLFLILQSSLFIYLVVFPAVLWAVLNEPEGFRDKKWQAPVSGFEHLTLAHQYGSSKEMTRADENLDFNGFKAKRILYWFTQDRFEMVTVQFETSDENQKAELKQLLLSQHGPGKACGATDVCWNGQKTDIKYNIYGKGAEIIYSDAVAWSKRIGMMETFKNKVLASWWKLSSSGDEVGAANALKKWLTQEGKDVLDFFSVSDTGDQIVLAFKGAGTVILTPEPSNTPQRLDRKKIYSISEVEDIFKNKPEVLRGKDVLLRCVAVDMVAGIGCNDYYILQDLSDAELYKRRTDKNLTLEEEAAIRRIPQILSAPTLGMPGNIVEPMKSVVYRGHFFDVKLNSCADGWKRFVIIDKEKE